MFRLRESHFGRGTADFQLKWPSRVHYWLILLATYHTGSYRHGVDYCNRLFSPLMLGRRNKMASEGRYVRWLEDCFAETENGDAEEASQRTINQDFMSNLKLPKELSPK